MQFSQRSSACIGIKTGIILLAGLVFSCSNGSTHKNYDTRPIVCFGDSLTNGYGAAENQAYPALLGAKIKTPVINAGVDGDTTADAVTRANSDVVKKNPQMVIVLFGANDVFDAVKTSFFSGKTVNEILVLVKGSVKDNAKDNLQKVIDSVKAPDRKIYLGNEFGPEGMNAADLEKRFKSYLGVFAGSISFNAADIVDVFKLYREMLVELAKSNNIEYIDDIWTGIIDKDAYMSDPIHPNAAGYKKMADHIFTAIKPYLQEKKLLK